MVCATEISDLSRMCIVLRGQDAVIEQARRQLEDLVRKFLLGSSCIRLMESVKIYRTGSRLGRFRLYSYSHYSKGTTSLQSFHPRP